MTDPGACAGALGSWEEEALKMKIILTVFVASTLLTSCSAADIPLIGPCAASKRVGPDKVYYDLALTTVVRGLWDVDDYPIRSEDDRTNRLSRIERYRAETTSKIEDGCLRAHAEHWVDFYDSKVRKMEIGAPDPSDYERREAEKDDQRRALAQKLGVRP